MGRSYQPANVIEFTYEDGHKDSLKAAWYNKDHGVVSDEKVSGRLSKATTETVGSAICQSIAAGELALVDLADSGDVRERLFFVHRKDVRETETETDVVSAREALRKLAKGTLASVSRMLDRLTKGLQAAG